MQSNIGLVLEKQGHLEDAERMYVTSLHIQREIFGEYSLPYADEQKNIADLRTAQGRYDEAAEIYTSVLHTQEKILGCDHPDIAGTYNK